jgi:predicted Zn-dependent peptidase
VLQDMVLHPAYPDVDSERDVVIEEIAMYEDEPSDKVHDVMAAAIFGDHPLGRPIIGRAEIVSSVPVPQIAAWHDGHYVPGNMVVAAAGNLDHDAIVRRFALRVLDTILGGSTSSRLFQEVREKRGLAYSVYSYANHYQDSGQVGLYVGTRPDRVQEAVKVIGAELRRLQEDGVTEAELEIARENVKGRTVLSMEATLTRMNRIGSSVLMDVPLLTVDEVLAAFDAVTLDDLATLARELWNPELLSAAGVGGDPTVFKAALDSVSPELSEAA